jgi:hypothetical protein
MEPKRRIESWTRMTTFNDRARLEFALNQAESYVARMGASPTSRRLQLTLEVLRETMASWATSEPTEEQIALVTEHVTEVRDLAADAAPTVRLRRAR